MTPTPTATRCRSGPGHRLPRHRGPERRRHLHLRSRRGTATARDRFSYTVTDGTAPTTPPPCTSPSTRSATPRRPRRHRAQRLRRTAPSAPPWPASSDADGDTLTLGVDRPTRTRIRHLRHQHRLSPPRPGSATTATFGRLLRHRTTSSVTPFVAPTPTTGAHLPCAPTKPLHDPAPAGPATPTRATLHDHASASRPAPDHQHQALPFTPPPDYSGDGSVHLHGRRTPVWGTVTSPSAPSATPRRPDDGTVHGVSGGQHRRRHPGQPRRRCRQASTLTTRSRRPARDSGSVACVTRPASSATPHRGRHRRLPPSPTALRRHRLQ